MNITAHRKVAYVPIGARIFVEGSYQGPVVSYIAEHDGSQLLVTATGFDFSWSEIGRFDLAHGQRKHPVPK